MNFEVLGSNKKQVKFVNKTLLKHRKKPTPSKSYVFNVGKFLKAEKVKFANKM